MKKILLNVCFISLVVMVGCKKEGIINTGTTKKQSEQKTKPHTALFGRSELGELRISENGYLMFEESTEMAEFMEFLNTNTHEYIQEYFGGLEFESKGKNLYNSENCDFYNIPTEEEQLNYVLNVHGVVEVKGVIMRVTDDNQFLLTVKEEYFSGGVYEDLAAGNYDEYSMNKFVTERLASVPFDLVYFINEWPIGYEETEVPSGEKRPMFGSQTTDCGLHTDGYCLWEECTVNHYFFWILTGSDENQVTPGSVNCL